MSKLPKSRLSAYLALLLNAVLWGLAIPIVKKGYLYGLTPTGFLFSRMFLALITSLPLILILRNRPDVKRALKTKNLAKITILEVIGTIFALLLLYKGVELTTAVESSLITMSLPIFITLGGILFLREKQQKNEWLGLLLALIGTFILVIKPLLHLGINGTTSGNLLLIAYNFITAFYYLLAKKLYKNLSKITITHISFWVGTIGFALILLQTNISPLSALTSLYSAPNLWPLIAVLYMAIPGSILSLSLYLYGQDKIEASEASVFTYLQPIFTIPASIILLTESVSLVEITAAAVIIAGVYLAEKR